MRLRLALTLLAVAGAASAQDFPSKPVQLLVPFTAGSLTDVSARAFAEAAKPQTAQPFVIVNLDGASGIIAMARTASAAPDGHTLFFGPQGQLNMQPQLRSDLPYKRSDIVPICQLYENTFAIIVGQNSPLRSVKDLIAAARKEPGKFAYGHPGTGTIPHMQMHNFALKAGIKIEAVGYKNYGQMVGEVAAGQLPFAIASLGSFEGRPVRPIAVVTEKRSPNYPDVPSTAEDGYPVPTAGFNGIYVAAATPAPVQQRLRAICAEVAKVPAFQAAIARTGSDFAYLDQPEMAKRLEEDYKVKGDMIRSLNFKPQ